MADAIDKVLDSVPIKGGPRTTVKWIIGVLILMVLGVLAQDRADAHIMRKTLPLRLRVGETSAVMDHLFEDIEDQRHAMGLTRHSLAEIRKQGRKAALEAEREDRKEE